MTDNDPLEPSDHDEQDSEPSGTDGDNGTDVAVEKLKTGLADAWETAKPLLRDAASQARDASATANEELSRKQKATFGGVGVLFAGLAGIVSLGLIPSTSMLVFGSIMLLAFAVGLFGIPAVIFLSADAGLGIVGRILWTIATLAQGGNILRHEDSGEYKTYAPIRDSDGSLYIKTDDGERQQITQPSGHWFRLGKKRFGMTYEKTEKMYGDLLADLDEERIATRGAQSDKAVYADGGAALLDMVRGGYQAFTPFAGRDNPNEDGWIVRVDKAVSRKRGAGGRKQAGKAKEQTLKEFGGNSADIQGKWFYIAVMGAMVIGSMSGYLAGGM